MSKIYNKLTELVGKTPLLELNNYAQKRELYDIVKPNQTK